MFAAGKLGTNTNQLNKLPNIFIKDKMDNQNLTAPPSNTLKPCPFCGGEAEQTSRFDVKCNGCGAEINALPGQAPELWNRRA